MADDVVGWQPIETAPEEEDVLLCLPRYGLGFPEMAVGKRLSDGQWYSDNFDPKPEYRLHGPTHWMPLPDPPAEALSSVSRGE